MIDTEKIRAGIPIPAFLAARDWPLSVATDGWRGACPIHRGENRSAFHVLAGGFRWHCHRCGEGGDIIDLVRKAYGLTFGEAVDLLDPGGTLPSPAPTVRPRHSPPHPPLPELDTAQARELKRLSHRLAGDPALCESLAHSRGWTAPTIEALALPSRTCPHGALGWLDSPPSIAFLYPHAAKLRPLYRDRTGWRWHRSDGSKSPHWLWKHWPWNAVELWREDTLAGSVALPVILTEGEPDAITVLDTLAGEAPAFATVAVPSATIGHRLRSRLPCLVTGREVILAPDADAAGEASVRKLREILRPVATTIRILHPDTILALP